MRMLYHVQNFWRCLEGWQLWVLGYGLKLPGARVNMRNDCRNDCKCSNPAKDSKQKAKKKTSGPVESSNANFFVKRALTKPLLWRMIEVSDSYLARLTALTFPMADGPFGMWVQLVLQHACNSGGLEGKFPLDPLSREKSIGPRLPMEFNSQDNWCKGMTEWPLPSPYPIWTESLMSRRSPRTPVRDLSQRQLWWPHFLRDRNSVQQCAYW